MASWYTTEGTSRPSASTTSSSPEVTSSTPLSRFDHLETERLLELGESAEGKDARDAQMILTCRGTQAASKFCSDDKRRETRGYNLLDRASGLVPERISLIASDSVEMGI